jgi:hypothetical protein
MTANEYRKIALGFPESSEDAHMGHPDFRVKGKIFATLGPEEDWGALKLNPEQQEFLIRAEPNAFKSANGAWGKRGYTIVTLSEVSESDVRSALTQAWRNTAPKQIVKQFDEKNLFGMSD